MLINIFEKQRVEAKVPGKKFKRFFIRSHCHPIKIDTVTEYDPKDEVVPWNENCKLDITDLLKGKGKGNEEIGRDALFFWMMEHHPSDLEKIIFGGKCNSTFENMFPFFPYVFRIERSVYSHLEKDKSLPPLPFCNAEQAVAVVCDSPKYRLVVYPYFDYIPYERIGKGTISLKQMYAEYAKQKMMADQGIVQGQSLLTEWECLIPQVSENDVLLSKLLTDVKIHNVAHNGDRFDDGLEVESEPRRKAKKME